MNGMIIVAVGITAMAIVILGTFVAYNADRDRVHQVQEASNRIVNERIKEDVEAGLDGKNLTIRDRWGGTSEITGLLVQCDDGRLLTVNATRGELEGPRGAGIVAGLAEQCG
ncbi:hypothetical protein CENSYa_0691 [Cenarchaeum symbiosum A]|uniref:Uncharacterized protein n=1 Tax=Cenarchaeum symbiosum (strain A) TaxID=414004 RepID=A0RVF7_CENSY|nr:hypothetical protein CENSYa_0691 [Cenarchaeum symbiosum A]